MAEMMDQQLPVKTNKVRRNSARQEGNRRGKRSEKKNPTAGLMVSQQTWITTVERVTIITPTTRVMQQLKTAWANQITPVDPAKTAADLGLQTEAEERQCLLFCL